MKYPAYILGLLFLTGISFSQLTYCQKAELDTNFTREKLIEELSLMQSEINLQFKALQNTGDKYGWESNELFDQRNKNDQQKVVWLNSLEEIICEEIWHSDGELGDLLISNLFSIIHYADSAVQEKYLPLMREIVLKSKAQADGLAITEDHIAMLKGKKQIYGTILKTDNKTNILYIYPLSDPDNVDKRRKAIGLNSFAHYLKEFNMQWDVEQYKLDLPKYEILENLKQ